MRRLLGFLALLAAKFLVFLLELLDVLRLTLVLVGRDKVDGAANDSAGDAHCYSRGIRNDARGKHRGRADNPGKNNGFAHLLSRPK